jgi:site-specific DNA recombinase
MIGYIGYTRVSTLKQGIQGVSLQEQRAAILRYAEKNGFTITTWLEEMETAAKRGRSVFGQMLEMLRRRKARGVIVHKLDRGVRNLKDWADVGELVDRGVEVHFANEGLDLNSRGGRLSADIQAVVAADYIRNLKEETRKGFEGRLKQGLYPLRAPIGYLDEGKGKPKSIDPVQGPLVRKAFTLYARGNFCLDTLNEEMYCAGLRNKNGGRVTRNGLSTLLNNSFYMGIMRIRKSGQTFLGIHKPLIAKSVFDRVQSVLRGKCNRRTRTHDFLFRQLINCAGCKRSLIGETQKGNVYYRCHTKNCTGVSLREESVEAALIPLLDSLQFNKTETAYLKTKTLALRQDWKRHRVEAARNARLKLGQIKDRLNRTTDAYLDGILDRTLFEERKSALCMEQKQAEEILSQVAGKSGEPAELVEKFVELASKALLSYRIGNADEKRTLVKILTSNRSAAGKNIYFEPSIPFQTIVNRVKNDECDHQQEAPRMWEAIIEGSSHLNMLSELPDLSEVYQEPKIPESG